MDMICLYMGQIHESHTYVPLLAYQQFQKIEIQERIILMEGLERSCPTL